MRYVTFSLALGLVLSAVLFAPANAHRLQESYIYLDIGENRLAGEFHVRSLDMAQAVAMDADRNRQIDDAEVEARAEVVKAYLVERLTIYVDGVAHKASPTGLRFFGPPRGRQIVIPFEMPTIGAPPEEIEVEYRFLYHDLDPAHTPLLLQSRNYRLDLDENEGLHSLEFRVGSERQTLDLTRPSTAALFAEFTPHGVTQTVFDPFRALFALILLLPLAALRRVDAAPTTWSGAASAQATATGILLAAGAVAIGHALAMSGRIGFEIDYGRRTESYLVLASILLVLWDNLRPIRWLRRWQVALIAGLLHGAGDSLFYRVIGIFEGMPQTPALAFSLGVGLGVLAIGVVLLAALQLLKRSDLYPLRVLQIVAVVAVAGGVTQFFLDGVL